jgi:hypothetical protein
VGVLVRQCRVGVESVALVRRRRCAQLGHAGLELVLQWKRRRRVKRRTEAG